MPTPQIYGENMYTCPALPRWAKLSRYFAEHFTRIVDPSGMQIIAAIIGSQH